MYFAFYFIIRVASRNREFVVRGANRHDPLARRLLRKNQTHLRPVDTRVTVGRVMHLEDDLRSGLNQFRAARRQRFRHRPRRVTDKKFFAIFFLAGAIPAFLPRIGRRLDVGDDVMHKSPVAGTDLGHLHPFVFRKFGGACEVLIFDRALRGDMIFFRHFQNQVGHADIPSIYEMRCFARLRRVALRGAAVRPGHQSIDFGFRQ